jgi:hypothetical protein
VQLDHRGLALLADIGPQARALACCVGSVRKIVWLPTSPPLAGKADPAISAAGTPRNQVSASLRVTGSTVLVRRVPPRRLGRVHQREAEGIGGIKAGQEDARQQRRLEQRAHRQDRGLAQIGQRVEQPASCARVSCPVA